MDYAGAQTFPNSTFGWTNVKDVVNAHIRIRAYEVPSTNGRYCLVESVITIQELSSYCMISTLLFNFLTSVPMTNRLHPCIRCQSRKQRT
ncbi:hypothetical protein Csa_002944 [Cucumis sativus]|nr:hypothetical protein Csa_002944 [Cucumis sativus]